MTLTKILLIIAALALPVPVGPPRSPFALLEWPDATRRQPLQAERGCNIVSTAIRWRQPGAVAAESTVSG